MYISSDFLDAYRSALDASVLFIAHVTDAQVWCRADTIRTPSGTVRYAPKSTGVHTISDIFSVAGASVAFDTDSVQTRLRAYRRLRI